MFFESIRKFVNRFVKADRLKKRSGAGKRRRPNRFLPTLEGLEERITPTYSSLPVDTIQAFVYEDLAGTGVPVAGDPRVSGVTITLSVNGSTADTLQTDANGRAWFGPGWGENAAIILTMTPTTQTGNGTPYHYWNNAFSPDYVTTSPNTFTFTNNTLRQDGFIPEDVGSAAYASDTFLDGAEGFYFGIEPIPTATSIAPDTVNGGVKYTYLVTGEPTDVAEPVALYWASGPNWSDQLGEVTGTDNTIPVGTAAGTYTQNVDKSLLVGSPDGTTNLLVVIGDPTSEEFDSSTDVASMDLSLDVPALYQTQGAWAVPPGYLLGRDPNDTIASSGCGLVSLVMALNYAGVATDPIQLNQQLTASPIDDGYTGTDSIDWGPATAIAAFSAGQPTVQWHANGTTDDQQLRDLITEYQEPVVVSVTNPTTGYQHFVLVTGLDGDTFYINDPGYTSRTTLDFYGAFQARGYVSDPPTNLSQLYVAVSSVNPNLNLSITNSLGQSTGIPFGDTTPLNQIPGAVYFVDGPVEDLTGQNPGTTTTQYVYIPQPTDGTYSAETSGSGSYTLAANGVSSAGQPETPVVFSGISSLGAPTQVALQLAGGQVTSSPSFSSLSAPTITFGTASTTISGTLDANDGGQNIPSGETVTVTLNGVTQDATLDSNDNFSTTFDTSTLAVAGSPYTIGFSYTGDSNFSGATGSSTLTVSPTAILTMPIFDNLGAPTITYGTTSTTITGQLNSNSSQPVPTGETIAVTLNGVTDDATILDTSGDFSAIFDTSALGVSGSPYTIGFSYAGDTTFSSATGSSTLTVQQAVPTFSGLSAPVITVGTASTTITGQLNSNTSQPVPVGATIAVTLNGVTDDATILDASGDFSASFNTSSLAVSGSPYSISFSYAGDANFAGTTASSTLTVTLPTPSFSGLNAPTITAGTPSVTLSGQLNSNVSGQNVPAGEIVAVTLNGVTQNATLDGNDDFSTTFDTSTLSVSGSPYLIAFSYAGDSNFAPSSTTAPLVVTSTTSSGLIVTDLTAGITAAELVQQLLGPGVAVSNIQLTAAPGDPSDDVKNGDSSSAGEFTGGNGIIGFNSGIILSTGGVQNVVGPNTSSSTSQDNNLPGDSDLTTLAGLQTYDATILQFDFVPTTSQLTFQYVFSSEEYNEWVGSPYNDVFGFYVNGQNVAVVPGTTTPVSINTINDGNGGNGTAASNSQFYINNDPFDPTDPASTPAGLNTEMDGLTTVLTAIANVMPGQINHIKLAIADTSDPYLDSNVFIEAGSFTGLFTPSFSNLSAPTISHGTPSTTISGTLNANAGGQNIPAGEMVAVTLNGSTQEAALDSNDDFSTNFDTSGLAVSGSPYTIGFSYAGDANFNSATGTSALTVSPAAATPTFSELSAPTITYGTTSTTVTGQLNSNSSQPVPVGETIAVALNGVTDDATILDTSGDFSASFDTSSLGVSGSPYTIGFSYAGDTNFSSATGSSTLAVNPAPLIVTATGKSMTYGGSVPALAYTYTGLVNGDPSAAFTGALTTTATSSSSAAGYPITEGNLAATGNYTIGTFNPGTLTVNPAPLIVTAAGKSMTYGGSVPTLTYTYTGLVNGDTSAAFTGTLTTTATSSSSAAGYPITEGNLAATGNYTIGAFNPGTLTVNPAPLIVTAAGKSMTVGGSVPALTYTYTGLVNGDASASFTGALATTATSSSIPGPYPITQGSLAATGNYTIGTFNPGTLTVNPATTTTNTTTTTVTSNDPAGSTYGQLVTFTADVTSGGGTPMGSVQFEIGGTDYGSPVPLTNGMASVSTAGLSATTHNITAFYTSSSASFSNSDDSAAPWQQTVNPAPLIVTAANKSMTYGGSVPALTYTYTGLVNGDPSAAFTGTLATTATSSSSPGPYPITRGSLAATGNYTIATFNPGTLTVNPSSTKTATTTVLVSFANPSVVGQPVTFLAAVFGGNCRTMPTGTVTLMDGSNVLQTANINWGGLAVWQISTLQAGQHSITAVYSGDSNFAGSTSAVLHQTVNNACSGTMSSWSWWGNANGWCQPATFTGTICAAAPCGSFSTWGAAGEDREPGVAAANQCDVVQCANSFDEQICGTMAAGMNSRDTDFVSFGSRG